MPQSATRPIVLDLGSPRFEPCGVLGEGGSGIVYEARVCGGSQPEPTESVALKVLRAELAPSERERRRFLDEARRMQRVRHPGLIRLLEAGLLPDGRPYLAMPRLEGETLAVRLRQSPLSVRTAVRWFSVLARAVHALHEAGIVHRDVKPENVIIECDAPVLLDFGIAREIDDDDASTTTAEGRIRGTPAYMAPERFFGAPASVRSDVYELAVVLYMMLVGRLPWGSEKNVTERLDPKSPEDATAEVSTALAAVILRALSTRPEVRPESAEIFAVEVELALDAPSKLEAVADDRRTTDIEVQSRPVSGVVARTASEAPRSRSWIVAGAAVIAVASAVGAVRYVASSRTLVVAVPQPSAPPVSVAVLAPPPSAEATGPPAASAEAPPEVKRMPVASARQAAPAVTSRRPAVTPATTTTTTRRSDEGFFEDRR